VTATPIAEPLTDDDDRLFCYRHPERETWIRCGRCDRPICTGCAMQGPVGSRCKQCGKLAFDPLTSFTPVQLALGIATALGGGLIAGFIAARVGFFSIFIGYFAGAFIADMVMRATGYKRGPVMIGIVFGGIALGTLVGAAGGFLVQYGMLFEAVGAADNEAYPYVQSLVVDAATWAVVSVAATCFGAWSKIR
jgi:MFS family permease